MKRIPVDLFFKDEKNPDCGPVASQMVLNHFGIKVNLDEIKRRLTYVAGGTYIFDNGLTIVREGLKAELITANPLIFKQKDRKNLKNSKNVLKHLVSQKRKKTADKLAITLFQEFIKNGGTVKIEIPTTDVIKKAIDQNKLVIALLYGGALGDREDGNFHYVVVSGYKKGFVYVNNSKRKSQQGWIAEKDFLYALHASTCVAIDNGSLLIVGK